MANTNNNMILYKHGEKNYIINNSKLMASEIENQLSEKEKRILELYKNPKNHDMKKQIRLSVQYLIVSGILLALTIFYKEPLYSVLIFLTFAGYIIIRLIGAKKITGVMPGIINKYENTIKQLKRTK